MENKVLLLVGCIFITACAPSLSPKPVPTSINEIEGTTTQRIKAVTQILVIQEPLPSPLLDAYFLEKRLGDGVLGPSDYISFGMLEVDPANLPAWRSKLLPLKVQPDYVTPKPIKNWWISSANYPTLELYELRPYTNRSHGWIGIDSKNSKIYIYTFTT